MSARMQTVIYPVKDLESAKKAYTELLGTPPAYDTEAGAMSVVVTPRGTRGVQIPRMAVGMMRLMNSIMFRIFKNRKFQNADVLLLTTLGAKTGQRRQSTLVYFPDRDNSILVVASAGGTAEHPAWFFNIAKHADQVWVRIVDRQFRVTPETLSGAERAAAWQRITTQSPVFAGYQTKTDRELPVIRLTPIA